MENIQLNYVDSKNIFGTLSSESVCLSDMTDEDKYMIMEMRDLRYSELDSYELTSSDRYLVFQNHLNAFAEAYNVDKNHIVVAEQNLIDGDWHLINNKFLKEASSANGMPSVDECMMVISADVPNVIVGHQVADNPVVIIESMEKKVAGIAHCGPQQIDEGLPMMMVEGLGATAQAPREDMRIIVGASIAGMNNIYSEYPEFAKDAGIWQGCIFKDFQGFYRVDYKAALMKQFDASGINPENIYFDMTDTLTDQSHYSQKGAETNKEKQGHQFIGAVYQKTR